MAEGDATATGTPDFSRRVVAADGRVLEAPTPEAAAEMLARRDARGRPLFTPDTPDAAAERARVREFGDRALEAGLAGAASEVTLGGSDVLARAVGGEDAARTLAGLEEYNPEASTGGRILGGVGSLLALGPLGEVGSLARGAEAGAAAAEGVGLLGRAARVATAPIRGVAAASETLGGLATRAAMGGAEAGLARRVAARGLGLGVEGAVEGAASELGRMVSEEALGRDPDWTAEALLARLGRGAAEGGIAGGVMGLGAGAIGDAASAAGRAGSSLARSATDLVSRTARARFGIELEPEVAAGIARALNAPESADALRLGLSASDEGRAFRDLINRGDDALEEASRDLAESGTELIRRRREIARMWDRGIRPDAIEGMVRADGFADQLATARAMARDARSAAGDVVSRYRTGSEAAAARGLDNRLRVIEEQIEALAGRTDISEARRAAELFNLTDTLKREVGRVASRATGEASGVMRSIYEPMRRTMEDAAIWGDDIASAQREINQAYARYLETARAFDSAFVTTGVEQGARADWDPFEALGSIDSARMRSHVGAVGTAANDTRDVLFRQTVQAQEDLIRAMSNRLGLDGAERMAADEGMAAARSTLSRYERLTRDARLINQWNAFGRGGAERAIISSAVGGAIGGRFGSAIGALASSPQQAIGTLAAVERLSQNVSGSIGASVRRFLDGATTAADGAARTARRLGRRAATAAEYAGVRAYQERTRQLDRENADVRGTVDRMAATTAGMEAAPRTRDALATAVARRNAYLSSVRPRGRAPTGQLVVDSGPPSRAEVSRFNAIARAVDEPMTILRDLEDGTITREAVAAVRQVYPRLFADITAEVTRQIAERGEDIPYRDRLALGILLGVPTDPALVPANLATIQAGYSAAPDTPTPAASRPAPRLADDMRSDTERLEAS